MKKRKRRLSVEEIRKALGADEVIPLDLPAGAGPLEIAATGLKIRQQRQKARRPKKGPSLSS